MLKTSYISSLILVEFVPIVTMANIWNVCWHIYNSTPRLFTKIFSVSCGVSMAMTNTMFPCQFRDLCLQLEHRVNQSFSGKIITGFTDTEANDVISRINKAEIDVNQVK